MQIVGEQRIIKRETNCYLRRLFELTIRIRCPNVLVHGLPSEKALICKKREED